MPTIHKTLMSLTAADLMSRQVVQLPEDLPLREAAQLLLRNQIGGAPVIDRQGRCVGVLSATDYLRLVRDHPDITESTARPLPSTCPFQEHKRFADGKEYTLCTLPFGTCSMQVKREHPEGDELIGCSRPHGVLADWQLVVLERLPSDAIRRYMTRDPVTVPEATSIRRLARMMLDAHVHRVIVVDEQYRPVGVVSATDLVAALAYAEDDTPWS